MTQVGEQELLYAVFLLHVSRLKNTQFTPSSSYGETEAQGHCVLKLAFRLLANSSTRVWLFRFDFSILCEED